MTGAELQALREAEGWTRAKLADRVGVSQQTIYRWETGRGGIGAPEERAVRELLKANG